MKNKISIIITARNYAIYLPEAIQSCLNQTVKPYDIIYSDDCSTDDSIKVAKSFKVTIVKHSTHVGVIQARNDGVAKSKGNILVHLDGDDIFPDNFLERHLETFDKSTPFTYCAAQAFGTKNNLWPVYAWNERFLFQRNFVNTSCMMCKSIFIKAGKWRETEYKTMWDWDLALRMSKLGTPKKSMAILNYRQHENSWSTKAPRPGHHPEIYTPCIKSIRLNNTLLSVGLVFSGRLPGLLDKWLDCLIDDIKIFPLKPELIIVNNSGMNIHNQIKKRKKSFSKIKILNNNNKIIFSTEKERRDKVSKFLADAYSTIIENSSGDLIHLREDDILTPTNGFSKMTHFILGHTNINTAVAALYYNRHIKRYIGGWFNEKELKRSEDLWTVPEKINPLKIDYTGTGCILFWKELCPKIYKSHLDNIPAHDWAWCHELKKTGKSLYILPDVICRHYNSETTYLQPKPNEYTITAPETFTRPSKLTQKISTPKLAIPKKNLNFAVQRHPKFKPKIFS